MIPFFPQQIARRAVVTYFVVLVLISSIFFSYAMLFEYVVLGIIFISLFFVMTPRWSVDWAQVSEKNYVSYVFGIAVTLRLIWVVLSYFHFVNINGNPFEVGAADAIGYHGEAEWLAPEPWSVAFNYWFSGGGFSDVGYPFYLTVLYKIFGPVIIIPRIFKALWSSWMCILIYRLSARMFGEKVGRIAGIMCALMPNLIIYCGYHLKETEMMFLTVAFMERTDYLLREHKYNIWTISIPLLLAGSLFFFRTVLGAVAVFAFVSAVLFANTPSMKRGTKRIAIIGWSLLCLIVAGGGTIMTEIEEYWNKKDTNSANKRMEQASRGNQWALYATGSVMAPMVVALPFATMVHVDEYQVAQETKHSGNYIRNFMAFFALIGMYEAIRQKKWRNMTLVGAYTFAYLGVISLSGFGNSERFLLPGLPGLIVIWTYGISELRAKTYGLLRYWCIIVVLMEVAWAYFKIGSRGLL
jgi:4-amino-4-deoxy-L-arabinose transferase-like glycosyltransferase